MRQAMSELDKAIRRIHLRTRIERAAADYVRARRDQKRWRKKLASFRCENEVWDFAHSDTEPKVPPCWKSRRQKGDWCAECKTREWVRQTEAIHYNLAVGGYASQLYRAVDALEEVCDE